MNLDQLYYVVEVAKTKSLSAAAVNLHVSQSAVSQSIANLEQELGFRIFNRSRQGANPTYEGKSTIKKALEVLTKIQELKDDALRWPEQIQTELRIATLPAPMSLIIETVAGFRADFPNVQFKIFESSTEVILEKIRNNNVDLGLIVLKKDAADLADGLIFEPIWEGKIVLGMWRNPDFTPRNSISMREMQEFTYALYDDLSVLEFVQQITDQYGALQTMFISDNLNAISVAVMQHLAVTLGFDFSFINNPYYRRGDLIKLEIADHGLDRYRLGWVRPESDKNTQLCKIFIQRLQNLLQIKALTVD